MPRFTISHHLINPKPPGKPERRLLGKILTESAGITDKVLLEALKRQMEQTNKKLGEILVDMGAVTMTQVSEALAIQSGKSAAADLPHYDLFLEREGVLRSWKLAKPEFVEPQKAPSAKDHAIKYLEFEGPLTGERGSVKVWDTGVYVEDTWTKNVVQVALKGKKLLTRLKLIRVEGTDPVTWTVEDVTPPVRRVTSALLQEPSPDPPPSKELEAIAEGLMKEERSLVALANRFLKAESFTLTDAGTDGAMRQRIQSELAKWRHPWLQSAQKRAQILDELAKTLQPAALAKS